MAKRSKAQVTNMSNVKLISLNNYTSMVEIYAEVFVMLVDIINLASNFSVGVFTMLKLLTLLALKCPDICISKVVIDLP